MITTDTIKDGVAEALLLRHMKHFSNNCGQRDTLKKRSQKRWVLTAFARWMKDQNITLPNLDESVIASS